MALDLRDNPIKDIPYTVREVQKTMPNILDLKLNLYEEDHVDLIMKIMPQLQFLNGLPVEREEDCSSEELSGIGTHTEEGGMDEYEFAEKDCKVQEVESHQAPTREEDPNTQESVDDFNEYRETAAGEAQKNESNMDYSDQNSEYQFHDHHQPLRIE